MELIITLRMKVADRDDGEHFYDVVKDKLKDYPNVEITGHVTNHFDKPEEPQ